ncbi:hypothetical protein Tco_0081070 [Tanacetum coccineum]
MEIELPGDLKEILKKLETFTSTISSLTSQVAELKTIQWELPTEFLVFPNQIYSVQEKLKTLDALPSLLNKVTVTLNRFASLIKQSSQKAKDKSFPSTGKSNVSPAEGEKNTYSATKEANLKNNLVDLMGIDVVEEYHKKKLLYDKYCDKMLKRRKNPKTTNCDVLTKKGPITLKVYREDWINEVISNFKVSDLHLAEWREVDKLVLIEKQRMEDHLWIDKDKNGIP